jgi:Zn-finger nucleic acid-binding protein
MKCPVCQDSALGPVQLEQGLPAFKCSHCEGIWVSSTQYFAWLDQHGPKLPEKPAPESSITVTEVEQAKVCPECGHFLRRYKIWPDNDFSLDHCSSCNGVWFDRNEWAALEARNLHDKINQFFTKPWQDRLRREQTRHALDQIYLEKFGVDDYERLKQTRTWIRAHPQEMAMLAFLQAEDPYEA